MEAPKPSNKAVMDEYKESLVAAAMNVPEGDKVREPLSIAAWLKAYGVAMVCRGSIMKGAAC